MTGEQERAAVTRWIMRYGDEINRLISRTPDGPIRTSMMGEFSACVTIRKALERGDHLQQPAQSGGEDKRTVSGAR